MHAPAGSCFLSSSLSPMAPLPTTSTGPALVRENALTWQVRLSNAIETANALAYLHAVEPPIIHRDVKTDNILLDDGFHVKVGNFGLSRLFPLDVTHVSMVPQGTPGYMDPVYHQCYHLTDKSDMNYSLMKMKTRKGTRKSPVPVNARR